MVHRKKLPMPLRLVIAQREQIILSGLVVKCRAIHRRKISWQCGIMQEVKGDHVMITFRENVLLCNSISTNIPPCKGGEKSCGETIAPILSLARERPPKNTRLTYSPFSGILAGSGLGQPQYLNPDIPTFNAKKTFYERSRQHGTPR